MTEKQAAETITPEQFFDEIVPQIMKATAAQRESAEGVCEIHLYGEPRSAWTINLKAGSVVRGAASGADVSLEMDRDDFQALMMNRLDIEHAVRAGRVRCSGKLQALAWFAGLLEPRTMEY